MKKRKVDNTCVTLPNHTRISVSLCGDIRISPNLVLHDVLFVPQFKFNLLSVNALTDESKLNLSLCYDHDIIQEVAAQKMIGKDDKIQGLYVLDTRDMNSFSNLIFGYVSAHI